MKKLYIAFLVFLPQILAACPMCSGSDGFSENSRKAYYLITALLGGIPVLIGIGVAFYVKSRNNHTGEHQ